MVLRSDQTIGTRPAYVMAHVAFLFLEVLVAAAGTLQYGHVVYVERLGPVM